MTIESSIYSVLASDDAVIASAGLRIYPLLRPELAALPAIVFQRVATDPVASLKGSVGLDSVRVQVSSWAADYSAARSLAQDVRAALEQSSLKIRLEMELDDMDEQSIEYRVIQDYRVWQ